MGTRIGVWIAILATVPTVAWADPVVQPDGKAGAATAWRTEGSTVVLTIDDKYDATEVAQAITETVAGARAQAKEDKVMVTGVAEAPLLKALAKVSVDPLLDDVDSMLQALQVGGDRDEGTGSSIRATKAMAMEALFGPPGQRLTATVLAVTRGKFPLVLVTIRIDSAPKDARVHEKQRITVVPRVPTRNGRIAPADAQSLVNVGAWYAEVGDRIELRLGAPRKRVWMVEAYRRIRP